jgi:hypothetical protein
MEDGAPATRNGLAGARPAEIAARALSMHANARAATRRAEDFRFEDGQDV